MRGIAAVLLGGGLGLILWFWGDQIARPRSRRARSSAVEDEKIWDLGPTLAPWWLLTLRITGGVIAAGVVAMMTHNIGEAIGLGFLGSTLPGMFLAQIRQRRRAALDTQCYTMANSLQLLLPITPNLVNALADARDNAEEPLASVLAAALRRETRTTGTATEFLRRVGHDLHLTDLELLGDILLQVNTQTIKASALLVNLVELWGDRLQTEHKRLGKITASARLGSIMIVISLGIQVLWPALDASARAVDSRLVGQVFGFVGAAVTVGAWMTLTGATRKAMQ
jgi:hypothetical protein